MIKKVSHYKFTILSVILILVAVLMPSSDVPSVGIPNIDKVVHMGMFGVLTLCIYGEYTWYNKRLPEVAIPLLSTEAFALATELMQNFADGRSCDVRDLVADSIGIVLVTIVFRIAAKKRRMK